LKANALHFWGAFDMNDAAVGGSLSSAQMDGLVVDRNHVDYDKYRRIWNALADRRPSAIVRARNVEDVRKTVQIAAKQNALLAVRSGGHSLPGLSTCDDGIVDDRFGEVKLRHLLSPFCYLQSV
jgi:FAD binding domain-containing protein